MGAHAQVRGLPDGPDGQAKCCAAPRFQRRVRIVSGRKQHPAQSQDRNRAVGGNTKRGTGVAAGQFGMDRLQRLRILAIDRMRCKTHSGISAHPSSSRCGPHFFEAWPIEKTFPCWQAAFWAACWVKFLHRVFGLGRFGA